MTLNEHSTSILCQNQNYILQHVVYTCLQSAGSNQSNRGGKREDKVNEWEEGDGKVKVWQDGKGAEGKRGGRS